ncbi:hypothetical protein [Mycolicibacterium sp.]|uniref:hypothetical protein n=1 Tax=Mycolicibacterium sp. TaxID=2320850 RepID=UPI003D096235
MRQLFARVPLPALAYVFTLLGFVSLGLSVAALAYRHDLAWVAGSAMVLAYAAAVGCVLLRRRQIATTDPAADVALGLDPIRGDTDLTAAQRYVLRYRGQGADAAAAISPKVRAADSADGHVPAERPLAPAA